MPEHPDIGSALQAAIAHLRAGLGDPTASLVVLTPSTVNGTFARRELAFTTPYVRVDFRTPRQLHDHLAEPGLRAQGLRPEPPGWLRATLARLLRDDPTLGPYGEAMRDPGWLPALTAALANLERSALDGAALRALDATGDVAERARLLARLLDGVAAARAADRLAGPADVSAAALAAAPTHPHAGAILLGDARAPRAVFATLQRYLATRPVARVDLPALDALPPARHGLHAAAPDATPFRVARHAPTLELVRTPDPVREIPEAVREAQRAALAGTPLDRIALVLPEPSQATTLREALERAGLPATWQTGPALAETPAARFLLHALSLALGDDSIAAWYELLRLPGLRLRAHLGELATHGRARWRRLLADCGAYRGTERILAALEVSRAEVEGAPPDLADAEAIERHQRALGAHDSLLAALRRVDADLAALADPRPLGAWARAFRQLLHAWWPAFPDQRVLSRLLESWSRSDAGPALPLAEAHATLDEALQATAHLRGSLKDASVRVLSPMQLLGGRFDLVCVTGLTQGRFPADPKPDPILSDPLVDALEAAYGAGLFHSRDRLALERRRFAALRAAAREHLWLSAPALDLDGGRPLLPGALLLELASERSGHRVGFRELEAQLQPRGRRSRPFTADASEALGAEEHLLARLHGADDDAADAALAALADHPWARRLLRLHRAADRLRVGDRDPALRPYAGFVDPAHVAALEGAPLSPRALAQLVDDPAAFLFSRVLGAWSAPRLRESFDPLARWYVRRVFRERAQEVLTRPDELAPRLVAAFEQATAEDLERAGADHPEVRARLAGLARRLSETLVAAQPHAGPLHALDEAPVAAGLPWRLRGGEVRRIGAGLEWVVDKAPGPRSQHKQLGELLEAAAWRLVEPTLATLRWVDVEGKATEGSFEKHVDGALEQLVEATERASAGFFGGAVPERLAFERDPTLPADTPLDEWLGGASTKEGTR